MYVILHIAEIIAKSKVGDQLELSVWRGGKDQVVVKVVLGEMAQ